MKIAQIAPIIERVPPKMYGGTERVVHELTEGLVKKGHEVTLFASGDSLTSAKLVSISDKALREIIVKDLYGFNAYSMMNIGLAYQMQNEFDIIHDHNGYLSLPSANIATKPVIMTYHGQYTPEITKAFQILNKPYLVSISISQAQDIPGLNLIGNVYNGLGMDDYPFSAENDGYLLYVGRISEEKGVHHLVEVAKALDRLLIIAAKLDVVDVPYFDQFIKPHLSEKIRWIGEVDKNERNKLMSRALCFLHPVVFKEPFGLTLIESMACGCPVVAFNKGSIPEIVQHGANGYVVENAEEMIEAVRKIDSIDRKKCRLIALNNFNAQRMVDGYEEIYKKILGLN